MKGDGLDEYRDGTSATEQTYATVDDFVFEYLRHVYARKVGPPNDAQLRWSAEWWANPEAVDRLTALWRAWEQLHDDPGSGLSEWWSMHADHHMPVLMDPAGPFARSRDRNDYGDPLPCERRPSR